jgi:hypothetical protein
MVTVPLVSSYDDSFVRSKSGPIWGKAYFQIGGSDFFPEKGWTDMVAAFLRNSLDIIIRIAEGSVINELVHVLDGPFEVGVTVTGP